jgi:hypothetical protein
MPDIACKRRMHRQGVDAIVGRLERRLLLRLYEALMPVRTRIDASARFCYVSVSFPLG